jgi:hypothetical protein
VCRSQLVSNVGGASALLRDWIAIATMATPSQNLIYGGGPLLERPKVPEALENKCRTLSVSACSIPQPCKVWATASVAWEVAVARLATQSLAEPPSERRPRYAGRPRQLEIGTNSRGYIIGRLRYAANANGSRTMSA